MSPGKTHTCLTEGMPVVAGLRTDVQSLAQHQSPTEFVVQDLVTRHTDPDRPDNPAEPIDALAQSGTLALAESPQNSPSSA